MALRSASKRNFGSSHQRADVAGVVADPLTALRFNDELLGFLVRLKLLSDSVQHSTDVLHCIVELH